VLVQAREQELLAQPQAVAVLELVLVVQEQQVPQQVLELWLLGLQPLELELEQLGLVFPPELHWVVELVLGLGHLMLVTFCWV
jgi:hypothetical protein